MDAKDCTYSVAVWATKDGKDVDGWGFVLPHVIVEDMLVGKKFLL